MEKPEYIIVAGASAGGTQAFCKFVSSLSVNNKLAIFLLHHSSREGFDMLLLKKLQSLTSIPCSIAEDEKFIEGGNIYIAKPDYHFIIKNDNHIKLSKGAYENRWRPSIDVLFRSAAVAWEENAIGIIFTGLLNDGTSGMMAIKECGGVTIVQDPAEAEFPEMPNSVLKTMQVDYIAPIQKMNTLIDNIANGQKRDKVIIPSAVISEAMISEKAATGIEVVAQLGVQSPFTCPDCGGSLWELTDQGFSKYRCHTGHAYSEADLLEKQITQQESSLWVALRIMQERLALLEKIQTDESNKQLHTLASFHHKRIEDLQHHIQIIKDMLLAK